MRVCFLSDIFSVLVGSFLLLLCSVVSNLSYKLYKLGYFGFYLFLIKFCSFLLLGFVCFQYFEYTSGTFHILSSSFGSIFYSLTGLHGLHVVLGLFLCLRLLPSSSSFSDCFFTLVQLSLTFLYVHIVDAVWVILVVFVYMPIWNY